MIFLVDVSSALRNECLRLVEVVKLLEWVFLDDLAGCDLDKSVFSILLLLMDEHVSSGDTGNGVEVDHAEVSHGAEFVLGLFVGA